MNILCNIHLIYYGFLLVSNCYQDKLPRMLQWLQMIQIYCLTILWIRSLDWHSDFLFWISYCCNQSVCHQSFFQEASERRGLLAHSMRWQNPVPRTGIIKVSLVLLAVTLSSLEPFLPFLCIVSYISEPAMLIAFFLGVDYVWLPLSLPLPARNSSILRAHLIR